MQNYRNALSPENLHLLATVATEGSLAGAARKLGLVPSALTYRLRQMEAQLDVLLLDRSSRRAQLTPAGHALNDASAHLLTELTALVKSDKSPRCVIFFSNGAFGGIIKKFAQAVA